MRGRTNPAEAETIALNALGFLVDSPEDLEKFMRQSGVDLATIRASAADRDFLTAVLDFLMADEALLVRFCESTQTEPKKVQRATHEFGGS
jgi:16S rRNA G527 N7-methylase RsmG